jgi:hypothetical protein
MPKGSESSRSLDPSDGLIGDSSSHIRPVTGAFGSGCLRESWSASPPRRKLPMLTGVARCDRHQFSRRSSTAFLGRVMTAVNLCVLHTKLPGVRSRRSGTDRLLIPVGGHWGLRRMYGRCRLSGMNDGRVWRGVIPVRTDILLGGGREQQYGKDRAK